MEKVGPIADRNMLWRTLVRAQWAQRVVRFEVSALDDPTRDLPKVWSDFGQTYQLLTPPEEEEYRYGYAVLPEFLFRPTEYHTTLMGDLLAEQMYDLLARETMDKMPDERSSFIGNEKAGPLIRDKFMAPGNLYHWAQLVKENVGEGLRNNKYLKRFCDIDSPREFFVKPVEQPPAKTD